MDLSATTDCVGVMYGISACVGRDRALTFSVLFNDAGAVDPDDTALYLLTRGRSRRYAKSGVSNPGGGGKHYHFGRGAQHSMIFEAGGTLRTARPVRDETWFLGLDTNHFFVARDGDELTVRPLLCHPVPVELLGNLVRQLHGFISSNGSSADYETLVLDLESMLKYDGPTDGHVCRVPLWYLQQINRLLTSCAHARYEQHLWCDTIRDSTGSALRVIRERLAPYMQLPTSVTEDM